MKHDGEDMPVRVSAPKFDNPNHKLDIEYRNILLRICTQRYSAGLISVHIGDIRQTLYKKLKLKLSFSFLFSKAVHGTRRFAHFIKCVSKMAALNSRAA